MNSIYIHFELDSKRCDDKCDYNKLLKTIYSSVLAITEQIIYQYNYRYYIEKNK